MFYRGSGPERFSEIQNVFFSFLKTSYDIETLNIMKPHQLFDVSKELLESSIVSVGGTRFRDKRSRNQSMRGKWCLWTNKPQWWMEARWCLMTCTAVTGLIQKNIYKCFFLGFVVFFFQVVSVLGVFMSVLCSIFFPGRRRRDSSKLVRTCHWTRHLRWLYSWIHFTSMRHFKLQDQFV